MSFAQTLRSRRSKTWSQAADHQQVRQTERTLEGFSVNEVGRCAPIMRHGRSASRAAGHLTLELDALIRREEDACPRACRALSTLLRELLPSQAPRTAPFWSPDSATA